MYLQIGYVVSDRFIIPCNTLRANYVRVYLVQISLSYAATRTRFVRYGILDDGSVLWVKRRL